MLNPTLAVGHRMGFFQPGAASLEKRGFRLSSLAALDAYIPFRRFAERGSFRGLLCVGAIKGQEYPVHRTDGGREGNHTRTVLSTGAISFADRQLHLLFFCQQRKSPPRNKGRQD